MSFLSRYGSKVGFALLYLAYVISYVDRTGTGSFDAAFDFLLVMTALAILVATTIRSRELQWVQSLA
jgi:hypothetical protein